MFGDSVPYHQHVLFYIKEKKGEKEWSKLFLLGCIHENELQRHDVTRKQFNDTLTEHILES